MPKHQYDPTIHHRHSTRLPTYDYATNGAYSITICTIDRQPILEHPELRTILQDTWQALPQRFPGIKLDEFVIMHNHIHFIVWLNPNEQSHPALGDVVGAYKSLTTVAWLRYIKAAQLDCIGRFWQRGYNEHVIRSEFELEQRRLYIMNNPLKEALKHNRL